MTTNGGPKSTPKGAATCKARLSALPATIHRVGLGELHLRSADGITFFVLVVAQARSVQFRAAVIRTKNFQRLH